MALRKGFSKDRNYDFWNILMCYLISRDVSRPEKERTLFGTLAYRLISKAAEAVPTDKVRFPTRAGIVLLG
jgi:N-terminal acetyltransferase B complex non-catalytic subunit